MDNSTQQTDTNNCKFITFVAKIFEVISDLILIGGSLSLIFGIGYFLYGVVIDVTIITKLENSSTLLPYLVYTVIAIIFGMSNIVVDQKILHKIKDKKKE